MAVPARNALRTLTQKAKAVKALRKGKLTLEAGDLTFDRKLEMAEVGKPGEVWTVEGQVVGRNQVVAYALKSLADGYTGGLPALCRKAGMPSIGTLMGWIRYNPEWKKKLQEAEEIRAMVEAENAMDRARTSGGGGDQVQQKGDELYVKTCQWMAERLDRKKYGEKPMVEDLGRELAMASEDQLMARVVAAVIAMPAMLERLAPKLKMILSPEQMAVVENAAGAAAAAGAVDGELVG